MLKPEVNSRETYFGRNSTEFIKRIPFVNSTFPVFGAPGMKQNAKISKLWNRENGFSPVQHLDRSVDTEDL